MKLSLNITEAVTIQPTFGEMLERLFVSKHTGPVIVHMLHGEPRTIEFPADPVRICLDRPGKVSADLT